MSTIPGIKSLPAIIYEGLDDEIPTLHLSNNLGEKVILSTLYFPTDMNWKNLIQVIANSGIGKNHSVVPIEGHPLPYIPALLGAYVPIDIISGHPIDRVKLPVESTPIKVKTVDGINELLKQGKEIAGPIALYNSENGSGFVLKLEDLYSVFRRPFYYMELFASVNYPQPDPTFVNGFIAELKNAYPNQFRSYDRKSYGILGDLIKWPIYTPRPDPVIID